MADVAGAMSLEALKGSSRPFDERLQAARPHPGQAVVARNLRALLAESEIMESHRDCGKVQDAYCLRCMPQVHGATRDALAWARGRARARGQQRHRQPERLPRRTTASADIISGGNFHGQPLALALDLAAMAVAELANISERRVEQLVNPALSTGLTPFLAPGSGLHSGFMIAQVASASLVSENKVLCHPRASTRSPRAPGSEDHVSMGSICARKLAQVVANVRHAARHRDPHGRRRPRPARAAGAEPGRRRGARRGAVARGAADAKTGRSTATSGPSRTSSRRALS